MNKQPALKSALLFSCGIILGRYIPIPIRYPLAISIFFVAVSLFPIRKGGHSGIVQLLIGVVLICIGAVRYKQESGYLPADHIIRIVPCPSRIQLKAFLIRDPIQKIGRIDLEVEAEAVLLPDSTIRVSGKVLVPFYETVSCSLRYGDEIVLRGRLEQPMGRRNPGGFDHRAYLQRKGIYVILKPAGPVQAVKRTGSSKGNAWMRDAVYPIRRFMMRTLEEYTSQETRPILKALILGDQGSIPDDVRDGFSKSGAVHILSVSGSHVGFVLLMLTTVFGLFRLPRSFRISLIVFSLIFYCLLAETSAPVVRAAMMAVIFLMGGLAERKTDPFNVIGSAAFVYLLFIPQDLFDLSFQLSFASVLSIVFFYQRLKNIEAVRVFEARISRHALARSLPAAVLVSVAAQIGTLPIIVLYFNRIPILSIFANLLAIPVSGLIMALGFTTVLFRPIHFWTASVYGALNQMLLSVFIKYLVWIGNLPFSHVVVPSPSLFHIGTYAAVVLFAAGYRSIRWRKFSVWILLLSINGFIWISVVGNKPYGLTWIQFDVGQGDAALLRFPRGKCLLVDGGGKTPYWDAGENVIAPYLRKSGIRKLDCVVLTHPHDDHVGGLISILEQFDVGTVITTGDSIQSPYYIEFLSVIRRKNLPTRTVRAPDSLTCFSGVKIYFLSPKTRNASRETNDCSVILRICFGRQKWLLMGDAGMDVETALCASNIPLRSDVIKIGHHGSETSTSEAFIRKTGPRFALISVGRDNRFGHPSPDVLQRLRRNAVEIIRTDETGAVILMTDGEKLLRARMK